MLLEAGFLALFFAPADSGPAWASNIRLPAPACFSSSGSGSASIRIWHRQTSQRRSRMATPDRDGRVLPERSAAHLDRLVRPAPAALVSVGTAGEPSSLNWHRFYPFSPARRAPHLLLHRHPVGDRHNPHRKLHLPELSRLVARHSPARRRLSPQIRASAVFFCKAVANQFRTGNTGS